MPSLKTEEARSLLHHSKYNRGGVAETLPEQVGPRYLRARSLQTNPVLPDCIGNISKAIAIRSPNNIKKVVIIYLVQFKHLLLDSQNHAYCSTKRKSLITNLQLADCKYATILCRHFAAYKDKTHAEKEHNQGKEKMVQKG